MFDFLRRDPRADAIASFHATVIEASRAPSLYGLAGFPDTVDGRFEALTLHVLLTLRRLRALPAPADKIAQELVDAVFAHLEIALRESGIGDFGVPKRIKKLGRTFYDGTATYDAALNARDLYAVAREVALRLRVDPLAAERVAAYCLDAERGLAGCDLRRLMTDPPFPPALVDPTTEAR